MDKELETALIEFLARVYARVPWGKMRTAKNPHDIFNHRVRAAARRGAMYDFASKLCNYFGLQSLPQDAMPYLDFLRKDETAVLNDLSSGHIPYCVRAIMRAKELKEFKIRQDKIKDLNRGGLFNEHDEI